MYYEYNSTMDALIGKVFTSVTKKGEDIICFKNDTEEFHLTHMQDCCECVEVEDIVGDLDYLVGSPILTSERTTNEDNKKEGDDSATWTFFKFSTQKGYVDIRFYGSSNGYYGEDADLYEVKG